MKIHIVKRGDTWNGLAAKYGVEAEAIRSANPQFVDPAYLQPGSKLKVPSARPQATVAQWNDAEFRDAKSELDYEYEVLDAQQSIDLEEEAEEAAEAEAPASEKKEKMKPVPEKPNEEQAKHPFQQWDVPAYEAGSFHALPEIPGMAQQPWGLPYDWAGMAPSYPGLTQESQEQEQEHRQCQSCMGTYPSHYAETMALPYPAAPPTYTYPVAPPTYTYPAAPPTYTYPTTGYGMQPSAYYPQLPYMQPYAYGSPYGQVPTVQPPSALYPRNEDGPVASGASQGSALGQEQRDEQGTEQFREMPSEELATRQQRSGKVKRKARVGTRKLKAEVKSQNTPWINL